MPCLFFALCSYWRPHLKMISNFSSSIIFMVSVSCRTRTACIFFKLYICKFFKADDMWNISSIREKLVNGGTSPHRFAGWGGYLIFFKEFDNTTQTLSKQILVKNKGHYFSLGLVNCHQISTASDKFIWYSHSIHSFHNIKIRELYSAIFSIKW